MPALSASASRADDGSVHLTMTNLSATDPASVAVSLHGLDNPTLQARLLTGDAMSSHNTFAAPEAVQPLAFSDLRATSRGFDIELPPRSIIAVNAR